MTVAAAWLLGTLCAHQLPQLPHAGAYVPLLLAAMLALRRARWRWLAWGAAAFVWTALAAERGLNERLPAADVGRDFALRGWIDGFPDAAPGQSTFSFAVEAPRPPGVPPRLRLTWYDPPALTAGDTFELTARLRPPHGLRNPNGFDYERWLLVNGFGATGYVRSARAAPDAAPSLRREWQRLRARIAERIAAAAPDADAAALLTALAIGERHLFSEQHWADFRRTGTSHLVAVSGMHVALLGVIVFVVVRRAALLLPQPLASCDLEAAAAAGAVCTAYYAALTGFAVPAQRSLLMIVVALAWLVSRRSAGALQGLAAALLAVLVWDPFAPLGASFWLSFVAVAIMLALAAPRRLRAHGRLAHLVRGAGALVGLQWSIGLALLPLTAYLFGEVSLLGPVVNLVAIPVFNFLLVPLTLLAAVVGSIDALAAFGAALVHAAGWLASQTVAILHSLAESPAAALAMPAPAPVTLLLAALGVAFAIPAHPLPGRRLAWLAVLPMLVALPRPPPVGEARIVVLDVGHGLAAIVETHTHRLLFDAGPTFRSGFDSGEEVVVPALHASGRRGLDRLVVSHSDNDHAGGARAVLAAFPRADVLFGPDVTDLPGRRCERGAGWRWDGVQFSVLHPSDDFPARGNESSCVLKVAAAGGSALLTGDIERRGEAAVERLAETQANVIVVPHHGSATSSSAALVRAVAADYALVSAGYANRWGFPKPEVRARWERAGAAVLVTADSGAITVTLGADGVAVRAERDGRHRYWQSARADGAQPWISW